MKASKRRFIEQFDEPLPNDTLYQSKQRFMGKGEPISKQNIYENPREPELLPPMMKEKVPHVLGIAEEEKDDDDFTKSEMLRKQDSSGHLRAVRTIKRAQVEQCKTNADIEIETPLNKQEAEIQAQMIADFEKLSFTKENDIKVLI